MPLPLVQDEPGPESYTGLLDAAPGGYVETAKSSFSDAFQGATTMRLYDAYKKGQIEENNAGRMLSVDELNQKYEGLGLSWDSAKGENVAQFIADRKIEEIKRQQRIEAGPQNWAATGIKFGASLAAHAVDPTELALTSATAGVFRVGAAAVYGAKALEGVGLLGRAALGFGEGATAAAALEPLQYKLDTEFQRDYSSTEALSRVMMGGAFGAALESGIYGAGKLIKKMRGTAADAIAKDLAISQLESGKTVSIDPLVSDFSRERSGTMPRDAMGVNDFSGRINYELKPFDPASPGGSKVYLGSLSASEKLSLQDRLAHGAEGFVDNPMVANADAASKYNTQNGMVHELTLSKDARILSTTQALGEDGKNLLLNALKIASQEGGEGKGIIQAMLREINNGEVIPSTLGDVFEAARHMGGASEDVIMKALEPSLEKAGFHGMHIVDEAGNTNRFEFFNSALESGKPFEGESRAFAPDERLLQKQSPEELSSIAQQSSQREPVITQSEKSALDLTEQKGDKSVQDFEAHIEDQKSIVKDFHEAMKEQAKTNPKIAAILEESKALEAEASNVQKISDFITKAAYKCVGING